MAVLSKQQILAAEDLPQETVAVPEWGGEVIVRSMTGAERDQFEWGMYQARKQGELARNLRARLVALTVVDDKGERVFADPDLEALGRKSAAALDRVHEVAQRLNGMTVEEDEELAKN